MNIQELNDKGGGWSNPIHKVIRAFDKVFIGSFGHGAEQQAHRTARKLASQQPHAVLSTSKGQSNVTVYGKGNRGKVKVIYQGPQTFNESDNAKGLKRPKFSGPALDGTVGVYIIKQKKYRKVDTNLTRSYGPSVSPATHTRIADGLEKEAKANPTRAKAYGFMALWHRGQAKDKGGIDEGLSGYVKHWSQYRAHKKAAKHYRTKSDLGNKSTLARKQDDMAKTELKKAALKTNPRVNAWLEENIKSWNPFAVFRMGSGNVPHVHLGSHADAVSAHDHARQDSYRRGGKTFVTDLFTGRNRVYDNGQPTNNLNEGQTKMHDIKTPNVNNLYNSYAKIYEKHVLDEGLFTGATRKFSEPDLDNEQRGKSSSWHKVQADNARANGNAYAKHGKDVDAASWYKIFQWHSALHDRKKKEGI